MKHVSVYGSYPIMSQQLNIWLLQGPFPDLLMLLRVLQKKRYCLLVEFMCISFFSYKQIVVHISLFLTISLVVIDLLFFYSCLLSCVNFLLYLCL